MVVKHQQVRSIIYRCGWVLRNDYSASLPALCTLIWREDTEGLPMLTGVGGILIKSLHSDIEGADHKGARLKAIYPPALIPAVGNEILKLHAASACYATRHKSIVQVGGRRCQLTLHKHLTHDIIDVWRVNTMTPKVAGTMQLLGNEA